MRHLRFFLLMVLCLAVGTGCARTSRPPSGPPGPPGLPPSALEETLPEKSAGKFSVQYPEQIRRIHHQMMSEAQHHLAREEMGEAIKGLQRLLALRPEPGLEAEGRWMLAQAFQRTGEWEGAREQYAVLASTPEGTPYHKDAKRHFQEIEALLQQSKLPPQDTQAVRLTFEQLPDSEGFDEGIRRMREDGVTTLLIDLGCEGGQAASSSARSRRSLQTLEERQALLGSFVARGHLQNLRVYAGVAPRCAGMWKQPVPVEWYDRSFDVKTKEIRENRYFDVFHPHYRQFLLDFLDQVAAHGVDGIIFLGDHPLGKYDGVSESGLKYFQQAFQTPFVPSEVLAQTGLGERIRKPGNDRSTPNGVPEGETVFWRWAGWKARERLAVLEELLHALRRRHLTLAVGLEIHPHGLTDPLRALVDYAEDAMEATRRPFSFFYVRPEIDRRAASDQRQVIDKLRRISTRAVLTRLLPVLDDPRRVWVSFPADGRKRVDPDSGLESSILKEFPSGIGVVHDLRAFS
jgi:hypothetical protein